MDQLDKIKAPIAELVDNFHSQFEEILSTKSEWLADAIELLKTSTGKKIRPILVALLSGLAEGQAPRQRSIDAAVLLELIHTATLIHDDVIDEAKTRRGRPTLGAIYDNRVAVLMGDFVLSSALIGALALRDLEVMQIVSSIGRELTEGEIRQFESADHIRIDEQNYYEIIRQKTAVLFASCARIAAITSELGQEDKERFTELGELLGMAFQIRDDILDYYRGELGKPTGNDLREGKVTLPLLHVLEQHAGSALATKALALLQEKPLSTEAVEHLTQLAIEEGGITYAEQRLESYIAQAKQLILHYPESIYRTSLLELADYIGARSY